MREITRAEHRRHHHLGVILLGLAVPLSSEVRR